MSGAVEFYSFLSYFVRNGLVRWFAGRFCKDFITVSQVKGETVVRCSCQGDKPFTSLLSWESQGVIRSTIRMELCLDCACSY